MSGDAAIVRVGGLGFRVDMPAADIASLDGTVTVHTVLQIRDENVLLFGFASERGRHLFRALTSVSGVGPKLALAVLGFHPPEALERAIAGGDADALSLVPGVGKKTAQRIVLELKDKLLGGDPDTLPAAGPAAEVREALKGLGYSAAEIQDVVATLPSDGDVPTLLRHALRQLGGREPATLER